MSNEILSKTTLDMLNRTSEVKFIVDFCGEDGGMVSELRQFMGWLGEHLRSELSVEAWEDPESDADGDYVSLSLLPKRWRLTGDECVAFVFCWPIRFWEESPSVGIYLPAEEVFPPRNALLSQLRAKLRLAGFTDHWGQGVPDPSVAVWKTVSFDKFQRDSRFELSSFVAEVVDGFRRLSDVEPMIDSAIQSLPLPRVTDVTEHPLKTIAFLDTESEGLGAARKMTQLAIVNVAYDPEGDVVVGVLDEYFKNSGQKLDVARSRALLQRAEHIVAHNAFSADKPLLASELPETEKMRWLCSCRGIPWKQLLDVQSESLETLMGRTGLRYQQDHTAQADANDLKRLLALKHKGRTYLGRLLDNTRAGG